MKYNLDELLKMCANYDITLTIEPHGVYTTNAEGLFGKSGIPEMEQLDLCYLHLKSASRGEEGAGPRPGDPNRRLYESMLRVLQMRRNFVWAEGGRWLVNPPLLHFVALELGKNVRSAPDAWCYLRESRVPDRDRDIRPQRRLLSRQRVQRPRPYDTLATGRRSRSLRANYQALAPNRMTSSGKTSRRA